MCVRVCVWVGGWVGGWGWGDGCVYGGGGKLESVLFIVTL